jgi:dipeptidyl aminopeptidase/acylaminoacyl peptidase
LIRPVGYVAGRAYPLITWFHGGPTSVYNARFYGNHTVGLLAATGFAVFLPNPRGSVGWGRAFAEANVGDLGGKDFGDILAGIDHLVEQGIANPDRLGVGGWSYGGFMTAWAITQTSRFKAAVAGAGIASWRSFHGVSHLTAWDAIHLAADPYELDGAFDHGFNEQSHVLDLNRRIIEWYEGHV